MRQCSKTDKFSHLGSPGKVWGDNPHRTRTQAPRTRPTSTSTTTTTTLRPYTTASRRPTRRMEHNNHNHHHDKEYERLPSKPYKPTWHNKHHHYDATSPTITERTSVTPRRRANKPETCNTSYDAITMIRSELFIFKDRVNLNIKTLKKNPNLLFSFMPNRFSIIGDSVKRDCTLAIRMKSQGYGRCQIHLPISILYTRTKRTRLSSSLVSSDRNNIVQAAATTTCICNFRQRDLSI